MNRARQSGQAGRLALGAAQFGLKYGVANTAGKVPAEQVRAIIAAAAAAGIDTIDTAIAYGNSEAVLGDADVTNWRVISKLPALPEARPDVAGWVRGQITASLQRLKLDQLDGLLLHRPADLFGPDGAKLVAALTGLREDGLTAAIGVSIYAPHELETIMGVLKPEIVQAPFNVIDRRLLTSGWLTRLAGENIRVHIRSAFLQGLLVMDSAARPEYFRRWRAPLDRWADWCAELGRPPAEVALAWVLGQPEIERVIVGIESTAQLDDAISAAAVDAAEPPETVQCDDPELLNPSLWKFQ